MTYKGRARNGQDKYTIIFEWHYLIIVGVIVGVIAGAAVGYSYGKNKTRTQQIESWERNAT